MKLSIMIVSSFVILTRRSFQSVALCPISLMTLKGTRSIRAMSPRFCPNIKLSSHVINDDSHGTEVDATQEQRTKIWNISYLKKDVNRLIMSSYKKMGKVEPITNTNPPIIGSANENTSSRSKDLPTRHEKLLQLESLLQSETNTKGTLSSSIVNLILELEVKDVKVTTQKPPSKKAVTKRLPYRRYYTQDQTEIRVGKTAEDNDVLSCSTEHRDSADWWMHASGCPGSHVVIRCHDDKLNDNVIQDAAALAARHSKCSGAVVSVSLTRCRDVKKPSGAKPGLVHLTKISRTVKVRMSEATVRLARLDETCQIN